MDALADFERRLPSAQRLMLQTLDSPARIQAYLDSLPYIAEELDRSPVRVMTDGQAHCLDGALFAAAALRRLGFPPLILDLVPVAGQDDDHVLALYRLDGLWGAVAKSNYVGLRFREPIHRSLRELVLTYFEHYYSLEGQKTLRAYTRPLDLTRLDAAGWMWDEQGVKQVSRRLYRLKPIPLFPPPVEARLSPVDERSYAAGTLGTDFDWVFGRRPNP